MLSLFSFLIYRKGLYHYDVIPATYSDSDINAGSPLSSKGWGLGHEVFYFKKNKWAFFTSTQATQKLHIDETITNTFVLLVNSVIQIL